MFYEFKILFKINFLFNQPMQPSYGGQTNPQGPAYPPPTQLEAPPGEDSNAAILLESSSM